MSQSSLIQIKNVYSNLMCNKFIRLARLNKPIGIYLALFPALWAVAFATKDLSRIILYTFIMSIGAISARSASCIINDILDKKFDKKIKRTRLRPLASGEVSYFEAYTALAVFAVISIMVLFTLSSNSIICGLIAIPVIAIYPLFKRFSYYPQVVLGLVFNIGALIGWFAVSPQFSYSAVTLYIASVMWTVGYDTIYGHQDRVEDEIHGVKSLSIKVGDKTQDFVWSLYQIMVIFFLITGLGSGMNMIFYVIVAFATYYLYWQSATLDINDPKDCAQKFSSNVHIGLILWLAIIIGKL